MQSVLLKCTLLLVILVTIVNHCLWRSFKSKTPFNRLLSITNLYIGFHALFVIAVEHFFLEFPLYDRLAPFSLMYGPLLYFSAIIESIEWRRLILHSIPFMLFTLLYILLVVWDFPKYPVVVYVMCFFPATIFSFVSYIIWAIVYNLKPIKQQLKQHKLIVVTSIIVLLFATMLMSAGIFSSKNPNNLHKSEGLLRFLIYGCLLCFALMINQFYYRFVKKQAFGSANQADFVAVSESDNKYGKSTLTDADLDAYLTTLERLMQEQQVYLYPDLSLSRLAQLARFPKHHITQVLNIKLKMNFYEYVNGFRVHYSCLLLKENSVDTLDRIAEQSGFNSKVSFNRHFKSIKGVTPSEYRLTSIL